MKACKTAFHVSCAFQNNLEMKTQLTDELADDGGVKLKVNAGDTYIFGVNCCFLFVTCDNLKINVDIEMYARYPDA